MSNTNVHDHESERPEDIKEEENRAKQHRGLNSQNSPNDKEQAGLFVSKITLRSLGIVVVGAPRFAGIAGARPAAAAADVAVELDTAVAASAAALAGTAASAQRSKTHQSENRMSESGRRTTTMPGETGEHGKLRFFCSLRASTPAKRGRILTEKQVRA